MSDITAVAGIGNATARILADHGIKTAEALASVTLDKLTSIPGFSEVRAKTAIAAAKASLESSVSKKPARAARKAVTKKTAAAGEKTPLRKPAPAPAEEVEAAIVSKKDKKRKHRKHAKKDKHGKSKEKKHKKDKKRKKDKKHKKTDKK